MAAVQDHRADPLEIVAAEPDSVTVVDRSSSDKEHLIRDVVAPLDSYTEGGVYWADLPLKERVRCFFPPLPLASWKRHWSIIDLRALCCYF